MAHRQLVDSDLEHLAMTTCTICGLAPAVPLSEPPVCKACEGIAEMARQIEENPSRGPMGFEVYRGSHEFAPDLSRDREAQPNKEQYDAAIARIDVFDAKYKKALDYVAARRRSSSAAGAQLNHKDGTESTPHLLAATGISTLMSDDEPPLSADLQRQINELTARVDRYRNDTFWVLGGIVLTSIFWVGVALVVWRLKIL
jgi:hypothetical protein